MKTDSRIAEAPWRALIVIAMLLLLAVPPGYAAQCPPNVFPGVVTTSLTDPQAGLSNLFTFNNPILDSTKLLKYATPVPNPLAPGAGRDVPRFV